MSGDAIGPIFFAHVGHQFLAHRVRRCFPRHQGHVGINTLALNIVGVANDGRLRDALVCNERALDLRRAHTMA